MKEYAKCLYYENACFDNPIVTVRDGQNRKHLTLEEVVDCLNEQQATINILVEELVNAQQQGYVVGFLHKNEHCSLIPKELDDE